MLFLDAAQKALHGEKDVVEIDAAAFCSLQRLGEGNGEGLVASRVCAKSSLVLVNSHALFS